MSYPLHNLTPEEASVLYKIFDIKSLDEERLIQKLSKLLLPVGGTFQKGLTYDEYIEKIAVHRNINLDDFNTVFKREQHLLESIFTQNFNSLSKEEKQEFLTELEKSSVEPSVGKTEIASIASLAAIGYVKITGFPAYMFASSAVAKMASLVGVTLKFGFYTGMSSTIKLLTGKLGVAILGGVLLFKAIKSMRSNGVVGLKRQGNVIFNGNYEAAEKAFIYLASLRLKKVQEIDNSLLKHNCDADNMLRKINSHQVQISELESKIITLKKEQDIYLKEKNEFSNDLNSISKEMDVLEQNKRSITDSKPKYKSTKGVIKF